MVEVVFLFITAGFPIEGVAREIVALCNAYYCWNSAYINQCTAPYYVKTRFSVVSITIGQ